MKVHRNWIICENYTPIGVVIVVDVVPIKLTTKELVVDRKLYFWHCFNIISKLALFSYQKKELVIFVNPSFLRSLFIFKNDILFI